MISAASWLATIMFVMMLGWFALGVVRRDPDLRKLAYVTAVALFFGSIAHLWP